MSKKVFTLLLCMFISSIFLSSANAQKKESHPAKQEKKALNDEEVLAAKRAALTEKTVRILKGKEWVIYVMVKPATEKKPAVIETDTLNFTERTVLSSSLSAKGYAKNGSNYSLSVSDDGTFAVWETMQLHENEKDMAFLRGELNLKNGVMVGSVVYKYSDGRGESYAYTTIKPVEAAPAVITQEEEPKKSKKR